MSEVLDISCCHILKVQRVPSTMGENTHIKAHHCEMRTRKESTNFWGVGRKQVTLKNKNSHQNNF